MQIVLNHVTRMRGERICIAGVEPGSRRHVRPTTAPDELLTRELLSVEGGFVEPGVLIGLGNPRPTPSPPEVEDHRCSLRRIEPVRRLGGTDYLTLLDSLAGESLAEVFGEDLYRATRWKYAVDPGHGAASLGVLRVYRPPQLEIDRYGKVTARLNDPEPQAYATVTDVRFFRSDHKTPREDRVDDVNRRLGRGVDAFLMMGLSRAVGAPGNLHWLQVNGICLADRPLGERP